MRIPFRFPIQKSLGIAARLQLGFSLLLVLMLAVAALGWFYTGTLAAATQSVVSTDYRRAEMVATMERAVSEIALSTTSIGLSDDPEDVAYDVKRLNEGMTRYAQASLALDASLAGSASSSELLAQSKEVAEISSQALALFKQIAASASAGAAREQLASFTVTQVRPPLDAWLASLNTLRTTVNAAMDMAATSSGLTAQRVRVTLFAAMTMALIGGLMTAWLVSRSIAQPLVTAVELARAVARGDLSVSLKNTRNDEIGALLDALADMQSSLRTIVGDIRISSSSIHEASHEVASGNYDLSQRTELTAQRLEQASHGMQHLAAAVIRGAESASLANNLAGSAGQAAERGRAVVLQVVGNMQEIANSSHEIAEITGVIDGIAFQTNLLALNAAVEAARAGAQGRGFAVVAGEVRGLAQRAAAASKDIKALINASVDKVESGSKLAKGAGDTMADIVESVRCVAAAIGQVTMAMDQQNASIGGVESAVSDVNDLTQQNAALVEQSAAAADVLSGQAERMNALIGTFRLSAPLQRIELQPSS